MSTMIPPLVITRVVLVYEHEDRSHVAIVANGNRPTSDLLDTIETLIAVKRQEIADLAAQTAARTQPEPTP